MNIKKLDETLLDMIIGIILFGMVCQIIGLFFVQDKVAYSAGLWIGTMVAIFMASHMWWALNNAMQQDTGGAEKLVRNHSLIRYGMVVLIFVLIAITKKANPLSAFLGIMGLKVAAYIQPITYKARKKLHNIFH